MLNRMDSSRELESILQVNSLRLSSLMTVAKMKMMIFSQEQVHK